MAFPNFSELATVSIESRTGELADNVSNNNALLKRLREKGNTKPVTGGRSIVHELAFAETSTYQSYYGYEPLNVDASDTFTAAEYDWKQVAVSITASGLEEIQNSGKEEIIDLVESRIKNAERTMMNGMSRDIYSDGSGSGGRQIGGLQLLVADNGTGIVGGINSTNWTFWQNQHFSGASDGGAAVATTNIADYMTRMYTRCVRGMDRPDLAIADDNFWRMYHSTLMAIERIDSNQNTGKGGFPSVKFMNVDVTLDGGHGGACPANHMYFLNTDYIFLRTYKGRDMQSIGKKLAVNQDASVNTIAWAGALTTSARMLQGVVTA